MDSLFRCIYFKCIHLFYFSSETSRSKFSLAVKYLVTYNMLTDPRLFPLVPHNSLYIKDGGGHCDIACVVNSCSEVSTLTVAVAMLGF